jgi:hypothetical protein
VAQGLVPGDRRTTCFVARRREFGFSSREADCAHHASCRLAGPHYVTLGHRRPEMTGDLLEGRGEVRDAVE